MQQPGMTHQGAMPLAAGPFAHARYTIKRPFFTFLGRTFHVYDPNGVQVLFVRHKVLSLKDKWHVYTDESMSTPLVAVGARSVIALNMITDVFDAQSGQVIGTLQSQGLKSILRDTWKVLGPGDAQIGEMAEDSNALLRRFFPFLLGKWHMTVNGQETFRLGQVFRFFVKEFTLDIVPGTVDPRFAVASALLALTREIARESQS
jgi:uncharacterized protein YxjI